MNPKWLSSEEPTEALGTKCYNQYIQYLTGAGILAESMTQFKCPYCDRKSASPGGVRFHIKLTHPDKLDEFNANYYPEMESRFKEQFTE